MRTLQLSCVTAMTLSLFTLNGIAGPSNDPNHGLKGVGGLNANSEPRPEVIPELKQTDSQLLGYYFTWPQRVIEQRFKEKLPAALSSSMENKSGAALSSILAELFATQLPEQVEQITASAKNLLEKREETDSETQAKSASNHLLEKIIDTGKWLLGQDTGAKTPERTAFLEQFEKDWQTQSAKVAQAIQMRDQAIDPNTTPASRKAAKDWLRGKDGVNREQVMAFINGQMKNGKTEEAVKWAKAMGWTDEATGQMYLDAKNGNNPIRLYMGKEDSQIAETLKGYEAKPDGGNRGLYGLNVNEVAHTANAKELSVAGGNIIEGRPAGVKAPAWVTPPSVALASADPNAGAAAVAAKKTNSAPSAGSGISPAAAWGKFCQGCHASPRAKGASLAALGRNMPQAGSPQRAAWDNASASEKAALRTYINSLP